MFENLEHMKGLVRGVGEQLSTLTVNTAPAYYNDLSSKIQLVRQSLEQMQETLQVRMSTGDEILDPFEQVKVIYVRQELGVWQKQLELYLLELDHLASGPGAALPCLAALVISRHPFPRTVFKEKKMQEMVECRLLIASRATARPLSKVCAYLIADDPQAKGVPKKEQITVQNDAQELSSERVARFTDMEFKTGTGVRKVKMQFEVTVEIAVALSGGRSHPPEQLSLRSDLSEPLIVMTHRSQWEEAEGALLKYDAFRLSGTHMQSSVNWTTLANAIQRHYLRVTEAPRPLAPADLDYLRSKLPAGVTKQDQFDAFWKWFGRVSKAIHLQKNLPMWTKGVIYGFLSKSAAEELLQPHPDGSAVLRFSDKNPGQFALAYKKGSRMHHYLMSEDDQKKPLLDFLSDRTAITNMLLRTPTSDGKFRIACMNKDQLIEECSPGSRRKRKEHVITFAGYEPDMS
jgi:hypothetical protein